MSTEKMRESFEAWAITSAWLGLVGDDLEFIDGGYVYPEVQSAWLSWQASRAAIEVELRDAYMKGWEASGEGWNGEYPAMLHESERWQRKRDQALGLD